MRNWEPARRVGVRRTIANLKTTGQIKKRKRQTRGQGETVKDDRGQREDDFGLRIEKRHGAWSMGHGERKLAANSEQQAEEKGQRGDCGLETGSTG